MKQTLLILLLGLAVTAWPLQSSAGPDHDGHGHEESDHDHDHDKKENHSHDDGHDHEDEEDGHGHEHGHDHDHDHGDEEGKTSIAPDAAKQAGISFETAGPKDIRQTTSLMGQIMIDQNKKADVRARFPGIVRDIKVNLGQQVKKDQVLAVVESNESLKSYNISAPLDGVILARAANIGNVTGDEPLFMIADLSTVWAKFHVFPKDAALVKEGQKIRVHTFDETQQETARVDMLFPTADAPSQTYVAIAPIPNENNAWRPGMTVEGDVLVKAMRVSLAVRRAALQTMENQTVVFVREGDTFSKVVVETGLRDGDYIEIKSGLKPGQEYVSEGSFIVKADIMKAGAAHQH